MGVVEDVNGRIGRELIGRRVVGKSSYGCGACDACRTGADHRCLDRVRPGEVGVSGAHAEYISLPPRAIARVADSITDEAAALAPMVSTIYAALGRGGLPPWTNVLVIGDGGMGMLCALALASAGYTVTLRGKHGNRFDLLRRHGIHFNLATDEAEITGSRPGRFGPALASYPFVFEATGHPSGWDAGTALVSPGGSLFTMTSNVDGVPRSLTPVLDKSIRVVGLRQGPLDPVLRILAANLFDPTEVIDQIYDFDQAMEAYERAREGKDRLTLLRISHLD